MSKHGYCATKPQSNINGKNVAVNESSPGRRTVREDDPSVEDAHPCTTIVLTDNAKLMDRTHGTDSRNGTMDSNVKTVEPDMADEPIPVRLVSSCASDQSLQGDGSVSSGDKLVQGPCCAKGTTKTKCEGFRCE